MDAAAMIIAHHCVLSMIWAACLMWALWWMMSWEAPRHHYEATKYLTQLEKHIHSRFFRTDAYYGSVLIYHAVPFMVVALLSFVVIELRKKRIKMEEGAYKENNKPGVRASIKTYPSIVRSPLGVLTTADVLFIFAILFLTTYSFVRTTYLRLEGLEQRFKFEQQIFKESLRVAKIGTISYCMGRSAMIPFALLWIPVSRGSPFLRLIKMPFEHAVKYHIWLSVIMLSMLALHSIGFIIYYLASHRSEEIIQWKAHGESCSVVAGVVALLAGLIMWVTSLSFFRRRWYELFFGVHHLYIIFLLFWLYHVIWTVHFFVVPCLLFMVDRFLRMLQSQKSVDVLSARLLESGSLHLKIAASTRGLQYHALSSWYLRIPSLSRLMRLQWHFFSTTSSPIDGKGELSFMIKPFGKWTTDLKDQLFTHSQQVQPLSGTSSNCPFSFKAGVEGPYGDESDFYIKYNVLILIGGGIGVTPLLALLCDILHRKRLGQKNLPTAIKLYHCVRKPEELCVLNSIDPNSIVPGYEKSGLSIQVFAYITSHILEDYRQTTPSVQNKPTVEVNYSRKVLLSAPTTQAVCTISSKGKPTWIASTMIASMVGFYVLWGLSNVFIIKEAKSAFPNYQRAHLVIASMLLGTGLFGGMVVLAWWSCSRRDHETCERLPLPSMTDCEQASSMSTNSSASMWASSSNSVSTNSKTTLEQAFNLSDMVSLTDTTNMIDVTEAKSTAKENVEDKDDQNDMENSLAAHGSPWTGHVCIRCRPCWQEIFMKLITEFQGENIGVLVSGPTTMQEDIARECQRHTTLLGRKAQSNIFHYHPISFDL